MKKRAMIFTLLFLITIVVIGFTYISGFIRTSYREDEYHQIYKAVEVKLTEVATTENMTTDDFIGMITFDDIKNKTDENEIHQRAINIIQDTLNQKNLYLEDKSIQEMADVILTIYQQTQLEIPVILIDSIRLGIFIFLLCVSVGYIILEFYLHKVNHKEMENLS